MAATTKSDDDSKALLKKCLIIKEKGESTFIELNTELVEVLYKLNNELDTPLLQEITGERDEFDNLIFEYLYAKTERELVIDASNYHVSLNSIHRDIASSITGNTSYAIVELLFSLLDGADYATVKTELNTKRFEIKIFKVSSKGSVSVMLTSFEGLTDVNGHWIWSMLGYSKEKVTCKFFSCRMGLRRKIMPEVLQNYFI